MLHIPEEAKCKREILCNFSTLIDNEEVLKEVCVFCKKVLYFNKKNGRIDNQRYGDAHFRDILQPQGAMRQLFIKIYGTKGIEDAEEFLKRKEKKKRESSPEELLAYARDTYKTAKKLESKGKL